MLHHPSNTRSTIGKYRHLTAHDWHTVQASITPTSGKASITTASGRTVTFTRAEVTYLEQRYKLIA